MPFIDRADMAPGGFVPQDRFQLDVTVPTPPAADLFRAAMQRENSIGSAAAAIGGKGMSPPDPSFDPWGNIAGYEDFAASFSDANSPEDVATIKGRIDNERKRADLLASGGGLAVVAEITAGIADPLNLIPVGGELLMVGRAGTRILTGAGRLGAAGGLATLATEGMLQATQETRTFEESAFNVAAATLLTGIAGGAIAAFGGRSVDDLAKGALKETEQIADDMAANIPGAGFGGHTSGGAAAASTATLETESIVRLGKLPEAMKFSAPTLRTQTSPVVETRVLAQELAEQPLMTKGNLEGQASPVAAESLIRQYQYPLAKALTEADDLFVKYRLGRDPQFGDIARIGLGDVIGRQGDKLSRSQFMEAVGMAMRRGDQSDVPEVAAAAASMRKNVFDPLKDEAIRLGLLPEDVDPGTAASYLMRQYNHQKIAAERNDFQRVITDWYEGEQTKKAAVQGKVASLLDERSALTKAAAKTPDDADVAARLARLDDDLQRAVTEWEGKTSRSAVRAIERVTDEATKRAARKAVVDAAEAIAKAETALDRIELADVARQTVDRILGTPAGRLPYDVSTPQPKFMGRDETPDKRAGALKGRVFMIPDELIERWLESDAGVLARSYNRTMAPDVVLARSGWLDFDEKIKPILESYDRLRAKEKDPAKLKALDKRMKGDIRDVKAIYERLRGTYALPDDPMGLASRTFRTVRDLNYMRLLGGMTISALPDVGRTVMAHGLMRVFGDGIVPLVTNLRKFRLAADEVKLSGEALDMVLDSRAMAIADVMDDFGRYSKFERGMTAATNKFGMVSLMAPWNAGIKQLLGVVSQTRSLQAIEALGAGKIDAAESARLARFGIGEDDARRIAKEFKAHGEKVGRLWWANTEAWTDARAAEVYRAALSKEVNQFIVTPGQEKPLWMSKEWGKTIGQFKSFSMASAQRVTMAGIQQRDMATLSGAAMMTGLGMLAYYIKSDHDRLSDDPAVWVREGIDRSGLTGWLFEVNNIVEKTTRGAVGVSRLTGGPMMSRYASRGVLESLLGPSAGLVNDAAQVTGSAATLDWKEADSRAVRRMMPFQNLIGFKYAADAAERGINDAMGVPMKN